MGDGSSQPRSGLKHRDQALFETVAAEARRSGRLHRNHDLPQPEDAVQRFLNVLQSGTDGGPHRH